MVPIFFRNKNLQQQTKKNTFARDIRNLQTKSFFSLALYLFLSIFFSNELNRIRGHEISKWTHRLPFHLPCNEFLVLSHVALVPNKNKQ